MTARGVRRGIAIVVLVLACLAAGVRWASDRALGRRYDLHVVEPTLGRADVNDPRARGRHLVTAVAQCPFCHGTDLGGREIADDPLLGRIDSANLTPGRGGIVGRYSRADWVRAMRHGIRPDGSSLVLMPAIGLSQATDEDLFAIIDYLSDVPPIDRTPRTTRFGWMTRLIVALGAADDIFAAEESRVSHRLNGPPGVSVRAAPTAEYGAYLVALGNCRVCHKADLRGGLHPLALPEEPPPPPLVGEGAMEGWSEMDFARAMREGTTPDGRALDRDYMPWPGFAALTDLETRALWRYLRTPHEPSRAAAVASR